MLYHPVYEMERMGALMNHLLGRASHESYQKTDPELANIYENNSGYRLEFLAPGVKIEDVSVGLENSYLTVSVKREEPIKTGTDSSEEWKALKMERDDIEYTRNYRLSSDADPEKIEAKLSNGMLWVTIGKKEEAKPRKIAVQVH